MSEIYDIEVRRPDGIVLMSFMLPADTSLFYDPPLGSRPEGKMELWVGARDKKAWLRLGGPFEFNNKPLIVCGEEIAAYLAWHSGKVGIRMETRP